MPFDPAKPANGSLIAAAELRSQFTGLKDIIDALPAPPAETDPVFAASEAALLMPGDKAKLDDIVNGTGRLTVRAVSTLDPQTEVALLIKDDNGGNWLSFIGNATGTGNRTVGDPNFQDPVRFAEGIAGVGGSRLVVTGGGYVDDAVALAGYNGSLVLRGVVYLDNGNSGEGWLRFETGPKTVSGDPHFQDVVTFHAGLKDGSGHAYSTGAYSPANAGHWDGATPATLAEAIDRLAAVVSNNGATPIP